MARSCERPRPLPEGITLILTKHYDAAGQERKADVRSVNSSVAVTVIKESTRSPWVSRIKIVSLCSPANGVLPAR